jgi:hypothetical protein
MIMECQNSGGCQQTENCPHIELAADRAVKRVFATIGVDVENPESIEQFREDLRFGKKLRRASDHGLLAIITLIVAGIVSVVWEGILSKIGGGH